jgi:hypothetical protein
MDYQSEYSALNEKIQLFLQKYYRNELIKGTIKTLFFITAMVILLGLSEYLFRFSSEIRLWVFVVFSITAVAYLGYFILIPLLKMFRLGKVLSHEEVAQFLGSHFPNIDHKLINIFQLHQGSQQVINNALIEAAIVQKIKEIKPIDFKEIINYKNTILFFKYALVVTSFAWMISLINQNIVIESFNRIVNYDKTYVEPAPFEIDFSVNTPILQGENAMCTFIVRGEKLPEEIYIQLESQKIKTIKNDVKTFSYNFLNVQKNISFYLQAGKFIFGPYSIPVELKAGIMKINITATPPSYTGFKSSIIENIGDIEIISGSQINWEIYTKNTSKLAIWLQDSLTQLKEKKPQFFNYSKKIKTSGYYRIYSYNDNMVITDSSNFKILVINDEKPQINVITKKDSSNSKMHYFKGIISDDFGFSKLQFQVKNSKNEIIFSESLPVSAMQIRHEFYYSLNFENLKLNPGDQVTYSFEVCDNNRIDGPSCVNSELMEFKLASKEEVFAEIQKNNTDTKKNLEQSLDQIKKLNKQMTELSKKLIDKKQPDWQDRKQLEQIISNYNQIKENLNEIKHLQQENKQNNPNQDEQLIEKQEKLNELFEKVMDESFKKKLEELQKMLEKQDKEALQNKLDEMKPDNKNLEKELDRSLELFKQMELEQKIAQTLEKTKELAKKQEKLAEKSEQGKENKDQLASEQEELNKKFDDIKKDIEDINKKNEELEEKQNFEKTDEIQQQIDKEQDKAYENLQQNNKKKASQNQKNASEKMNELSEKMQQMQDQMNDGPTAEDMNNMRNLLENLIKSSFDQEKIMLAIKNTNINDPKYVKLTQDQQKLKANMQMIEDTLFALSKRVPQISSTINKEISGINANMEKATKYLAERQSGYANERQQNIMTSVNNLALILNESIEQSQKQQQSKQQGQANCNKPGSSGSPKPSLKEMKEMQKKIAQQMEKMKQQMEKEGNKPNGQKPTGQRGGKLSEDLVKTAAQQEALRNQLRKIADEIAKNKEGGGLNQKSNLQKIQEQMEKIEEDLMNKRITNETLKRQQDIMTRLLEAENAERERDKDERRQSNTAKDQENRNPIQYFEYKKDKSSIELIKQVPISLNPYYKNKVNDYFNRLQNNEQN